MDRIVFGDNQFFGINHMSEDKARTQAMQFRDVASIIRVIDAAWDCEIRTFMFTTHEMTVQICDHFRANQGRYPGLRLCPAMPYAHKYAAAVAEVGITAALTAAISGNVLGALSAGATAVLTQNPVRLARVLVDTEMRMFSGLETPVVLLQNIVTDLLVGLRLGEALQVFADQVRRKHGAEPGFITMDLPRTVAFLKESGIDDPIVCSPVNSIGYLMNPSRGACEDTIRGGGFRPWAMSVFASGAVPAREAVDYVASLGPVGSIVFGASSRGHIEESIRLIRDAVR